MLTVISWFAARRARRSLRELVEGALTGTPALVAVVCDQYTNEDRLRPFAPLAERFAPRLDVVLAAEFPQEDREREGDELFVALGVSSAGRRRLLRDEGDARNALVVRKRTPVAILETFFAERASTGLDGRPVPDPFAAREGAIAAQLQELLGRLPPAAPPPSRALAPGEHDFSAQGLCRLCNAGASTLSKCPGTKVDDAPRRDRFELIELD